MTPKALRTWSWLHKWSSLVCTIFMLLLCLTGLPLIFHHEIGHLLGTEVEAPPMPGETRRVSLDRVLEVARAQHPDRIVQFASQDADDPNVWFVTLTHTPAPTTDFRSVAVDGRTGAILAQPRFDQGFMYVMYKLHVDLFADCRASSSWASWGCCCWWPSSRAWCSTRPSCASWISARCAGSAPPA